MNVSNNGSHINAASSTALLQTPEPRTETPAPGNVVLLDMPALVPVTSTPSPLATELAPFQAKPSDASDTGNTPGNDNKQTQAGSSSTTSEWDTVETRSPALSVASPNFHQKPVTLNTSSPAGTLPSKKRVKREPNPTNVIFHGTAGNPQGNLNPAASLSISSSSSSSSSSPSRPDDHHAIQVSGPTGGKKLSAEESKRQMDAGIAAQAAAQAALQAANTKLVAFKSFVNWAATSFVVGGVGAAAVYVADETFLDDARADINFPVVEIALEFLGACFGAAVLKTSQAYQAYSRL